MTHDASVEEVISFRSGDALLWGILARPAPGIAQSSTAVLVVVGGPQYRVGSHRQFVLLARGLASHGFACLRFDNTGMGDSEGDPPGFDSSGPDLHAALDALCKACPTLERVVVWGLCDAASAALMFATRHPRVAGIVAANPWARSDASLAVATVKHYYGARLLEREFWLKLLRGRIDWRASLGALAGNLKGAGSHYRGQRSERRAESFQTVMARGLASFKGQVLLILSGRDLTAKEFLQYADSSAPWKGLLAAPKVSRVDFPEADHTFSRRAWLNAVEAETVAWLKRLGSATETGTRDS